VEAILELGYNVQLEHDDKETTWEDHGYVVLELDGKVICQMDDYQHNKKYRDTTKTANLVEQVPKIAA